ncbi:MAG: GldG family protein [Chloroflexi bacterium]|nr:GldG family protein [Chloroflexota bacterium]
MKKSDRAGAARRAGAAQKQSNKRIDLRQYAPLGLWLSLAAILSSGILLLIKLLAKMGLYTPPSVERLNLALWISLGLAVIGPALYSLLEPQRVRAFLTGRQARYGSNAAIMLVAFLGILVAVNVIAYQNPHQWDLTEDKQNSLAPETLDTLKALPQPVTATAFYTSRTPSTTAQELLDRYKAHSAGKFDYTLVDPDQKPLAAQQAGITGDGKIYLQMGDQHEIVSYASEQEITASLIRLMNPGERSVYFLTGHGERDIQKAGDTAYTQVRAALEAKNYKVQTLNLIAQNQIPQDALAIIIAGPQQPLSTQEMTLIESFVARGGALIAMQEPLPLTNFGTSPDPLADYLSNTWGITYNNDIVIDPNSNQPIVAVANSYSPHLITEKLQGLVSFYPTARSLAVSTEGLTANSSGAYATPLVITIDRAWGETDFDALQNNQVSYDQSLDFPGPLTLGVAAENPNQKSRLVVFGDADFASDGFYGQYANGDMLINAIDWAAQQENLIHLTAKEPITRTLNMPGNTAQLLIGFMLICAIPGLIVAAGIVAWLKRRVRG